MALLRQVINFCGEKIGSCDEQERTWKSHNLQIPSVIHVDNPIVATSIELVYTIRGHTLGCQPNADTSTWHYNF